MEIERRKWELVGERCPDCRLSELVFYSCSVCGALYLICEEEGDVFAIEGTKRGEKVGGIHNPRSVCKSCGHVRCEDFKPALSEEIRNLGFDDRSYQ